MTIPGKDLLNKDVEVRQQNDSSSLNAAEIAVDPQERAVLSKFDKFVMPQMALLVLFAYLDRTNIGNARVFGLEEDTGMKGTDFNDISMYFYISYVVFETPWVMAVKRLGPGRVLAIAIVSWSAITIGTGFINSYGEAIALRVLLGFFEAGLFPALIYVISEIYPPASQGKRVAVLYITIALSGALGGLFAYGVQSMGARHGLSAWRWLFIVEGTISLVIGIICWVSLPTLPETAWFLKDEEKAVMMRIKERDQMSKEKTSFSWPQVVMAITDPFVYLASVALFCSSIALFGFGTFLPTLLKGLGWVSNNIQPDYKRSVSIAMLISLANASGMAASQIYPSYDAPRYIMGNGVSLGGEVIALICIGLIYALLKWRMGRKERLLAEGKESNGKNGDQALHFQYVF
ncbi:hypothetical protein COL26b_007860 [Colletotrichum chrysophilum]|uniref:uncharacterized protein n=1 Tax=Colletotrichum chrysophilum TaxID=1836956 RepID=UPI00230116E4|nr:uncharacterized protein COL26b_007860 [Colletotrichum chrysophilum]KAJ0373991.1 hypothetical protein COL26b_007860 [Colletotrichum chrysophilum]